METARTPWHGSLALGRLDSYLGSAVVSGPMDGPMVSLRNEGWALDDQLTFALELAHRQHRARPEIPERQ